MPQTTQRKRRFVHQVYFFSKRSWPRFPVRFLFRALGWDEGGLRVTGLGVAFHLRKFPCPPERGCLHPDTVSRGGVRGADAGAGGAESSQSWTRVGFQDVRVGLCAGSVFLLKSKKRSREDCRVCRTPSPPESRAPAFRMQRTSLGVLLAPRRPALAPPD